MAKYPFIRESAYTQKRCRENRWPDSKLNRERGSEWKADKWESEEETERPPLPCSLLFISFPSCHSCDKVATWDYWEKDKLQPRSQPASTVCTPDTSPSATVPKPGSLSRREKKLSVFYERRAIWYFLQKVLPWYKFLNQSGQARRGPQWLWHVPVLWPHQTLRRARAQSGEIPPEGSIRPTMSRATIPKHTGTRRERARLTTRVASPLTWQVAGFVIGADQYAICHSSPSAKSPPPPAPATPLMLGTLWLPRKKSPPLH